mmetsp:Transcript_26981/g.60958  ORF Transcript_26981/g.60958 Transcript_26981/m.60958 type:complete len:287 (-) Transcript_26981:450-1310(-)
MLARPTIVHSSSSLIDEGSDPGAEVLYLRVFKSGASDRIGVSFDPAAVELPGVRISYIDEEGQAARAGLLKWDKVLSLNGFPLECPLEAAQVLRDSQGELLICVERCAEAAAQLEAEAEAERLCAEYERDSGEIGMAGEEYGEEEDESAGSSAESDPAADGDDTPAWLLTAETELQRGSSGEYKPEEFSGESSLDGYAGGEVYAEESERYAYDERKALYSSRSGKDAEAESSWHSLLTQLVLCNKCSTVEPEDAPILKYQGEQRPAPALSFSLFAHVQSESHTTML